MKTFVIAAAVVAMAAAGKYDAQFGEMDTNADGLVSTEELKAYMGERSYNKHHKDALPHIEKAKKSTADLFKAVDTNGDGWVTRDEAHSKTGSSREKLSDARRWEFADADKNDKLDENEMCVAPLCSNCPRFHRTSLHTTHALVLRLAPAFWPRGPGLPAAH